MSKYETSFDVLSINHIELKQEITDSLKDRSPLFIWGPPGIGKSVLTFDVAKATAEKRGKTLLEWVKIPMPVKDALLSGVVPKAMLKEELGMEDAKEDLKLEDVFIFADFRLAQVDATDLIGIPQLNSTNGALHFMPPALIALLGKRQAQGMLFLDEMNQAMPMVQNLAYQLVENHACGAIAFSDNVTIIAAGNRQSDGGHQTEMSSALANRLGHFELQPPTIDDWSEWAFDTHVDPRIIAFLKFKPSVLMDDLKDVRKNHAKAWASPRSWVKVSSKIKDLKDINTIFRKTASLVGEARAIEFRAFVKTTMNLNIDDILKNPAQVQDFDLATKWALISAVAEHYRSDPKKMDPILKMSTHLTPDFAVSMLRMMREYDPKGLAAKLAKSKHADIGISYLEYFK